MARSASVMARRSVAFCVSKASCGRHLRGHTGSFLSTQSNWIVPFSATPYKHPHVNIPEEDQVIETKIATPTMPVKSEDKANDSQARAGGSSGNVERESGVMGFVAGTAREGVAKAMETREEIGDVAERTLNSAFDAAKGTAQKLKDTVIAGADENVVDTTEYRSIEDMSKRADSH